MVVCRRCGCGVYRVLVLKNRRACYSSWIWFLFGVVKKMLRKATLKGIVMPLFLHSKKPLDLDASPFSSKELTSLINKIIEIEIEYTEIDDYRDSFISNYANASLSKGEAIKETVRMIMENDGAVAQLSELANATGINHLSTMLLFRC